MQPMHITGACPALDSAAPRAAGRCPVLVGVARIAPRMHRPTPGCHSVAHRRFRAISERVFIARSTEKENMGYALLKSNVGDRTLSEIIIVT